MAKAEILVPRSKDFEKRVQRLAKEGSQIVESYTQLTERMLKFASAFKEATDEAYSLDEGADGIHAQYLRDRGSPSAGNREEPISHFQLEMTPTPSWLL